MREVMPRTVKGLLCLCMSAFFFFSSPPVVSADPDCKEFIETHSAKHLAQELGKPEKWVRENYRIKLMDRETGQAKGKGKGKVVGKLPPGSRAEILKIGPEDYQVKNPQDGSVGWINRAHVRHVMLIHSKTLKLCR
jgi:hypothetical protein